MGLGTEALRTLDQLLDEALELAPDERGRWLDRLGPDYTRLAPTLRELLARDAVHATADVLDRAPALAHLIPAFAGDSIGDDLAPGSEIGPYRLLRELGVGGMGVVWLGERIDGLIDRPVALKLPLFSAYHRALAERFARERAILARLTHPNIARLYDAGITAGGQPYLALEYVEGEPLNAWCDARRATVRQRVALVATVLRAVQYAHANLVIHRDLKPSNILVTAEGDVRLLDFGIAKLVHDGDAGETELTRLAGRALTPAYAAPELLSGTPIGIASDVYSIGVILFELLCGARPYRPRDASRAALEESILHAEALRPSVAVAAEAAANRGAPSRKKLAALLAGDLDTITLKALKKRPEDRYPTAAALAEDLERYLRGDAIDARADSALYRTAKLIARHRVAFGATGVIVLALVTGASVAIWQAREARREVARANAVQQFVLDLFKANSADQPDPIRARQTTARELLDFGSARVANALADQPESRLQLLETLSKLYSELGLWAEASELGAGRVELARSLYGADDLRVADAISDQLFFLDMREGTPPEEIDALVREAMRIHDARGDRSSLPRAQLHERASVHYLERSIAVAIEHAQRAVDIYRERYTNDAGFPKALAALANTHQRQGDWPAALTIHDEALRVARTLRLPDHSLLFFIRRAGETNAFMDRGEQADALLREALAMSERVNGPKHAATIAVRRVLARNLAWMSRLDEAAEVAARAIADVTSGEGRESYLIRDTYRVLFDVHWARGDLVSARDGNAAALATYGAAPPDTFEHADLLIDRSTIETAYGRVSDALAALERARAIADRLGMPRESMLRGNLTLRQAQARLATGDARAARIAFEQQLTYWRAGRSGVASSRAELHAGLVDALLTLGERTEARRVAQGAADELAREPGRAQLVEAQAQLERAVARVLMADRAFDGALPHVERASELYRKIHLPQSPFRAETEALRAICLARLGRLDEARSAVALARTARLAHGTLGPQFDAPLREAESLVAAPPARMSRSPAAP